MTKIFVLSRPIWRSRNGLKRNLQNHLLKGFWFDYYEHKICWSLGRIFGIALLILAWFVLLSLVEPLNPFSLLPQSLSCDILLAEDALSMLFAIGPFSFINASISEGKDSESFLFIVSVLSLIPTTVEPSEDSSSVHLVVFPFSLVNSSIFPDVSSEAMNVILAKLSLIWAIVLP